MSTPTTAKPHVRPSPLVASGQLSKITGLPQYRISELVSAGLPAYELDSRRFLFDPNEATAWLIEHGHVTDPYRAAIKKAVDQAPEVTADQAAKIRAILGGGAK